MTRQQRMQTARKADKRFAENLTDLADEYIGGTIDEAQADLGLFLSPYFDNPVMQSPFAQALLSGLTPSKLGRTVQDAVGADVDVVSGKPRRPIHNPFDYTAPDMALTGHEDLDNRINFLANILVPVKGAKVAPKVATSVGEGVTRGAESVARPVNYIKQVGRNYKEIMEPTADNFTSLKALGFPTTTRFNSEVRPNNVIYQSKNHGDSFMNRGNGVTISSYLNDPAAHINILPEENHSRGAARDVWDFIDNILPDYGTLASSSTAKTISQLSPKEKMVYVFTNRLPKPTHYDDYSLDVARELYGFHTNPVRAAKKSIKVEISPNIVMDMTNSISKDFYNAFPDIRATATDVPLTQFTQWTPEQVDLWNHKYTQLGYPPIDPEKRTMPYLVLKKNLKRNSYVSFQHLQKEEKRRRKKIYVYVLEKVLSA